MDARKVLVDPTGTAGLRVRFRSDFSKRWQMMKQAAREMIDKQDILGLKGSSMMQIVAPGIMLAGTRQEMFARWFDVTLTRAVYGNDGTWIAHYLERAFQMGTKFAQEQINEALTNNRSQYRFDAITALARAEMTGIMDAVKQQSIRVVALGIGTDQKPMAIVRGIWAVVDRTGINRSSAMLNLMVVKAFGDATLDVYETAKIQSVGLIPESAGRITDAKTQPKETIVAKDAPRKKGPGSRISRAKAPSRSTIGRIKRAQKTLERRVGEAVNVRTAGDADVCEVCEDIAENGPYSLNKARTLIPAHPHCRCVFIPAGDRRFAEDLEDVAIADIIRKLPNGKYRLYSKTGKNLGTFATREEAEKHEREVKYFKHKDFKNEKAPARPNKGQTKETE